MYRLSTSRKGFTLVEVALAVAVGLIIIGGAVLGYNAVKDNASNSTARSRVLSAVTMVEEYTAVNAGMYPDWPLNGVTSTTTFGTMWRAKRPDDFASSPWGGAAGGATGTPGVVEATVAMSLGYASQAAAVAANSPIGAFSAPAPTSPVISGVAVPGYAAAMSYMPVGNPASPATTSWALMTLPSTSSTIAVKGYIVGIFGKDGMPWWDAKGGR